MMIITRLHKEQTENEGIEAECNGKGDASLEEGHHVVFVDAAAAAWMRCRDCIRMLFPALIQFGEQYGDAGVKT